MSFVQKAAGFLLLPLYTSYLTPDQFGIANVINSSAAIYIMIFSLALDDAVARFYFIYKSEHEIKARFLGSVVVFTLLISIFGSFAIFVFKGVFFGSILSKEVPTTLIILGIINVATSPLYAIQQKINIIEEKPFHYTLNTFSFFLINTFLCILFVVKYHMGAIGLLLSATIVQVIFYVYSIFYLSYRIKLVFETRHIKEALAYSLPLLPNRISSWGLVSFNNIYLGKFVTLTAVGIYNVANYFGLIITVVASSVSLAYQPFVFKILDNGAQGKENLEKIIVVLSLFFTLAGMILAVLANDLLAIFINERYSTASVIIPTIIWGETIGAISTSYIYILFYYTNTPKFISYSTIISSIINISGCIILIPIHGLLGAVLSLFISNIFSAAYKFYYAQKVAALNLHGLRMFLIPTCLFAISILIQHFHLNIVIKLFVLMILFSLSIFINIREIKYVFKNLNT